MSLQQGNVFTPVCHSVTVRVGLCQGEPPPAPTVQLHQLQAGGTHPTGMYSCGMLFHDVAVWVTVKVWHCELRQKTTTSLEETFKFKPEKHCIFIGLRSDALWSEESLDLVSLSDVSSLRSLCWDQWAVTKETEMLGWWICASLLLI